MDSKYAELLLKRCLDLKNSTYLYIYAPREIEPFARFVNEYAKNMGISTRIAIEDTKYLVEELKNTPLEEIHLNPLFTRTEWNEVAKENGAILFLETVSEDYFEDLPLEKFEELMRVRRNSKPIYDQKLDSKELSWCIASYPCKYWADRLFPKEENNMEKLKKLLYQVCMIDKENPIDAWNLELQKSEERAEKLNHMHIKYLHYQNELGTDFKVELPNHYQFCSAAEKNIYGESIIVNMPSYEVFTSPDYRKTEGKIVSSKPLFYQGRKIEDFSLIFEKGKVKELNAKIGEDILRGIVDGEENSSYLGEVALVNYDSPISKTGILFETTLLDENASCHVALGAGFSEAILNGEKMTEEETFRLGINKAKTHVDFMIGTSDLKIDAITEEGKRISIFKDGNFMI